MPCRTTSTTTSSCCNPAVEIPRVKSNGTPTKTDSRTSRTPDLTSKELMLARTTSELQGRRNADVDDEDDGSQHGSTRKEADGLSTLTVLTTELKAKSRCSPSPGGPRETVRSFSTTPSASPADDPESKSVQAISSGRDCVPSNLNPALETSSNPENHVSSANEQTGGCCNSKIRRSGNLPTGSSCLPVQARKGCCGTQKKAVRQALSAVQGSFVNENVVDKDVSITDETDGKAKTCCGPSERVDRGVGPVINKAVEAEAGCCSGKLVERVMDPITPPTTKVGGCCRPSGRSEEPVLGYSTGTTLIPKAGCCDDKEPAPLERSVFSAVEDGSTSGKLSAPFEIRFGLIGLLPDEGDDEICPCCIKAAVKALVSGQTLQKMNELADRGSKAIRRCCRIFHGNCARMACCLPVSRGRRRSTSAHGRVALTQRSPVQRVDDLREKSREQHGDSLGEKYTGAQRSVFRLEGMDCASCTIKVVRAATKLESVQSIEVDYFASRLALDHDPHRIDTSTIAGFVSRATGFQVTPQLEDDDTTSSRMSLPIKTEKPFCQDDTDKYTVVDKKGYFQVTFDPKVHRPRDVINDLGRFGATLVPREQADDRRALARRAYHVSLIRSIACIVLVIPTLVMTWGSPDLPFEIRQGVAMSAGSTIVLLSSSLLLGSIRSLVYLRHADVQLLVAVSTITAYIFSVVAFGIGLAGGDFEEPFFETPALLLTLVHIGGSVQAYARRTVMRAAASMQTMQPDEALLVDGDELDGPEHQWQLVDTRLLHYSDVIRIETDGVVAADGILIDQEATIDESCMTGESIPAVKGVGSLVVAGCINVGGPFHVQVSRLVHENTAAKMADLVNRAHQTRLPVQDAADRIAAIILPATLGAAAIAFLVWSLVSRFVRDETPADAGISGLTYAIAVVAVACPCALVLVSPMVIAMVVNIGLGAGIIFRSTAALWSFHDMDIFAFDKTGTLTEGKMRVLESSLLDEHVSPLVAALVADQSHPISRAVSAHIGCAPGVLGLIKNGLADPVVHPGKGLQSTFAGFALLAGSAEYAQADLEPSQIGATKSSVFYVTLGGLTVARFALQDTERPDVKDLVRMLQAAGKRVVIISGDLAGPVERLAASIGVVPFDASSRCSPSRKLDIVRDLQASGARICYVGDGANDAAALAAADISIAIGGGADLAQATADITIASDRRLKDSIMSAMALARVARWHIKAGFAWSIVYNIFAVLLASGAFVVVRIAPRWAGLGELASILPIFALAFGTRITWNMLHKTETKEGHKS